MAVTSAEATQSKQPPAKQLWVVRNHKGRVKALADEWGRAWAAWSQGTREKKPWTIMIEDVPESVWRMFR